MIIQGFAVAGSPASVKVLLDSASQNKLSQSEISSFMTNVADNVQSAVNLPQMMVRIAM